MRIDILPRYLIGQRQAILDLAADRRAIWVGALFVLSAGFAREYDGSDLLHEPWHLLIPFVSSLGAGSILFLFAAGKMFFSGEPGSKIATAYRGFIGLFWMTAPMAWLYAVPYEHFLSPYDALVANLITLAIVSVWRVALMVRVVNVVFGYSPLRAVFLVLAFADVVALTVAYLMPAPVIDIMGGVRLTPEQQLTQGIQFNLFCWGILAAPVVLVGAAVSFFTTWPAWKPANEPTEGSRGLQWLAIASVVIWLGILPFTQGELTRRWRIENALKNGRIRDGLALLSEWKKTDFAAGWDPPPQLGLGRRNPNILDVMDEILENPPAQWVREIYVEKFFGYIQAIDTIYYTRRNEIPRIASICGQLIEPPRLTRFGQGFLVNLLEGSIRSESDRDVHRALLEIYKRIPNKEITIDVKKHEEQLKGDNWKNPN